MIQGLSPALRVRSVLWKAILGGSRPGPYALVRYAHCNEEQVVGRGGFKLGIEVGIRPRMLRGVIGECLVKILSIAYDCRAARGSPQNSQLQRPDPEEVA
jgi:hypothetical protein